MKINDPIEIRKRIRDVFPCSYSTVEKLFTEITGVHLSPSVYYYIGQKFTFNRSTEDIYMLVQTADRFVCMVGLKSGNRWQNPERVNSPYKITKEELAAILGPYRPSDFHPLV